MLGTLTGTAMWISWLPTGGIGQAKTAFSTITAVEFLRYPRSWVTSSKPAIPRNSRILTMTGTWMWPWAMIWRPILYFSTMERGISQRAPALGNPMRRLAKLWSPTLTMTVTWISSLPIGAGKTNYV